MNSTSRRISWVHLVAAAAVCFMFVTEARADQLIANDFQATSSAGAFETTPTLGSDNGVSVLVYTSINLATFSSRVRYQRLTDTGTLGPAVDVGSSSTNDNLNDVSGNWIVYTASQTANPGISQIRKYRISDGFDTGVSGFGSMGEARIHGGNIAWVEGNTIFLSVAGAAEFPIAGPVPAASQLEIGDTFVVFQQDGDIWAYDLVNGGSSKAANGGSNPSTSGSWAVWESAGIIQGLNLLTGATVALGDAANINANPSIDGNNVAWESNAAGNFDIYLHRLAEGDTFQVTTNLADQQLDSLHGGQVAYLDNRNGLDIWVSTFSFAADPLPDPDPTPAVTWVRQFGTGTPGFDNADGIAVGFEPVSGAPEVYVVGTGAGGGFVRKYDANGNELWVRSLGTQARVNGVTVNLSGGVYVVGLTSGALPGQVSAGGGDAFVRKYDFNGNEVWTRQFGTSANDGGRAITFTSDGDVYVAGETSGTLPGQVSAGGADAFVRSYSSTGTELWTRQFGSAGVDLARVISANEFEEPRTILVAGVTSFRLPGQIHLGALDAFVRKLDANTGGEVWTRQFGSPLSDDAFGIAVDDEGFGVYVAGSTNGTLPGGASAGSVDGFVRKYDLNGSEVWTRQFGTPALDNGLGISVDASGVYVAGFTDGTFLGQTSAGGRDAYVRQYDDDGVEGLTFQFGTPDEDQARSIFADSPSVYVAGLTRGTFPGEISGGSADAYAARLNPAFTLDTDGDGIVNELDTAPNTFSNDFSDVALGGTTTGSITDRAQLLTITEEPNPQGVRITAAPGGGPDPARVAGCPLTSPVVVFLDAGEEVVLTCSSADVAVTAGTVDMVFFALDGGFVTASVGEGNSLVFDATTSSVTAPSTNPDTIVVFVKGVQVNLVPGNTVRSVAIDIKPGSSPNSINVGAQGALPVAILTTPEFDASEADGATLTLAGAAVRLRGRGQNMGTLEDVDGDGDLDLVVKFSINELSLVLGSSQVFLEGQTLSGQDIRGVDSVRVVPE